MKWFFTFPLILIFSAVFALLTLSLEPIIPYISQIDADPKDLMIVKRELSLLDKNLSKSIMKSGNYPITIDFIKFSAEDADMLGYSIVDDYACDIKINLNEKWSQTKFKLVLYHEIGHCFGLDHEDSAAIMEASLQSRDKDELASLPLFYTHLENTRKTILVSSTGFPRWDNWVNEKLDKLSPPIKEKYARKNISKYKKNKFKFNPDLSKKITYEE